jgi:hypothetical protein
VIRLDAEHDAVGLHEVVDRRSFLEELRIAAHVEGVLRVLRHRRLDLRRGAHRDGRFRDDDELPAHVHPDLLGDGEDVAEVGGAVLVGRRADGDEDDARRRDRGGHVGREAETAAGLIALDEPLQAGLVDGKDVLLQAVDLLLIQIRADDVVPRLREAGPDDESDVSRSDYRDVHVRSVQVPSC